jgi:hypothetical protein
MPKVASDVVDRPYLALATPNDHELPDPELALPYEGESVGRTTRGLAGPGDPPGCKPS